MQSPFRTSLQRLLTGSQRYQSLWKLTTHKDRFINQQGNTPETE